MQKISQELYPLQRAHEVKSICSVKTKQEPLLVLAMGTILVDKTPRKEECDLIHDYALPLPMIIIREIRGVPTQDRNKFHAALMRVC